MVFPKNNLPTDSQPWTRDVEKRVENLESTFRSAEINNVTRDSQALSQIRRLDAAVVSAQAAADEANAAIAGLTSLGTDGSTYSVHGGNITANTITANEISSTYVYAGTIDADQINAGTVTGLNINGGTLSTTGARHVEISGTNANFYDSSGTLSGRVTAGEDGRAATMYFGTGISGVFAYNGGLELESNGTVQVPGGNGLSVTGGNLTADNRITSVGTYNATAAFAANVFIASNGNFARATGTSSREAKQDIAPLEFDKEAFLEISPVTFKYKDGIITEGENPQTVGFIAEDFVDAGLSEFLVTPTGELDPYIGLRYDKMYMFLHSVVQSQAETIKALEARIAALEGQV